MSVGGGTPETVCRPLRCEASPSRVSTEISPIIAQCLSGARIGRMHLQDEKAKTPELGANGASWHTHTAP